MRRIAAAHGGKVTVDSVHGEGSRFTLRLPGPAPAALEQALHPESGVPQTNPTR